MILANLRANAWRFATLALGVLAVALLIVGLLFGFAGLVPMHVPTPPSRERKRVRQGFVR